MKLTKARKQRLARETRDRFGVEITPDEAERHLSDAVRHVRARMVARGYPELAGASDAQILRLMHEAMGG